MYRCIKVTKRLDREGYVKIEFVDHTGRKLNTKNIDEYLRNEVPIDHHLLELYESDKLNLEALLGADFNCLLRFATYLPVRGHILNELNVRGVPLKGSYNLFPHQIESIRWMRDREQKSRKATYGIHGGILSLLQGLGKTLTALVTTLSLPKGDFPTLIIAPKSVIAEWKTQGIEKFFPPNTVKALYLHKDHIPAKHIKQLTRAYICRFDFVITNYDTLFRVCKKNKYNEDIRVLGDEHSLQKGKVIEIKERTYKQADLPKRIGLEILYGTPWERVICDESHRFVNPATKTFECVMAIYGKYKWCMTGTPVKNTSLDCWSQLRFCGYKDVKSALEWSRSGPTKYEEQDLKKAILTMGYAEAGITLKPKTLITHFVRLTDNEEKAYQYILGVMRSAYDDMMNKLCDFACILALFVRLRQCAVAPYLITNISKRDKRGLTKAQKRGDDQALSLINGRVVESISDELGAWCHDKQKAGMNAAKIKKIVEIIRATPKGDKVMIFSSFTACLDLVSDAYKAHEPKVKIVQIDGGVIGKARSDSIDVFRTNPKYKVAFCSYKCAGEGLNFCEARHVILIEPWWNDATHQQAISRVWRMGQQNECFVHFVLSKNTIEDKIMQICQEKAQIADSFLGGTELKVGRGAGIDKYTIGRIIS